MKKLSAIILALALLLSVTACGSSNSSTTSPHSEKTQKDLESIGDAYNTDPKNIENAINAIVNNK